MKREYRRLALTPVEADRLSRKACPNCGKSREIFNRRNKSMDAVCCSPECSREYWRTKRPTIAEMRELVYHEQGGLCAACKQEISVMDPPSAKYPYGKDTPYVLDHIRPIAMGGSQWDRDNLQVLCHRCNKSKTARDLGQIARYKKYHHTPEETRQAKLDTLEAG